MVGVKTEGKNGVALDEREALKFFVLCMIVGTTAVIGGYSLGDTANELITWFDQYADDTKKEGDEKKDASKVDPDGTSAMYDIIYHYVTLAMSFVLFTEIGFGGHLFAMEFMKWNDDIVCDFDIFDNATIDDMKEIGAKITSLENCYKYMPSVMNLIDHNKNDWIDRCEDANILKHLMGNTEEYARKYSHSLPKIASIERCDQLFNPLY